MNKRRERKEELVFTKEVKRGAAEELRCFEVKIIWLID